MTTLWSPKMAEKISATKEIVCDLHSELIKWNLVIWTAGNVSQRVRGIDGADDVFVIKPSGIAYDQLTPEDMVVCDLDGNVLSGKHSASSDTAAHAYVYRHMPEVGGVTHTHSTYATAWAAVGKPIPCHLTMMGDEFGGEIPIGPFALIGDDSIGQGILETLKNSRSRAVLMQNHGPFTIGADARASVKTAAMTEEVAHTMWAARQLGQPLEIPQEKIDSLYERYQNVYGQHSEGTENN